MGVLIVIQDPVADFAAPGILLPPPELGDRTRPGQALSSGYSSPKDSHAAGGYASQVPEQVPEQAPEQVQQFGQPVQPVEPATATLNVTVPEGVGPGSAVTVNAPDGQVFEVIVPDGVGVGDTFAVQYVPIG